MYTNTADWQGTARSIILPKGQGFGCVFFNFIGSALIVFVDRRLGVDVANICVSRESLICGFGIFSFSVYE